MSPNGYSGDITLIVIKHPDKGEAGNGKTICDEVRAKISGSTGQIVLMHNATGMQTANSAYAAEFKQLDKDVAERVIEIIAAIPGSIPRMMAHTVAMFSDKSWSIFKDLAEAVTYLGSKGFPVSAAQLDTGDKVTVVTR